MGERGAPGAEAEGMIGVKEDIGVHETERFGEPRIGDLLRARFEVRAST